MSSATNWAIDAFAQLRLLEERVRMSGCELPKGTEAVEQWAGVNFRLGGLPCVVRLDDLAEILVDKVPTRLPGCADWVKGVLNVRGRLLPVFSLPPRYLPASLCPQEGWQVLVVEGGKLFCGIRADKVVGMEKFSDGDFRSPGEGELAPCGQLAAQVRQVTDKGGALRLRLDLAALATSLCALDPAAERNAGESKEMP